MELKDIQPYLGAISQLFSSPQQRTPVVPYTTGYHANMRQYRPGFVESVTDMLYPGRQRNIPQNWAVSDWRQMMRTQEYHTRLRNKMTEQSSMANATAKVLLSRVTGDEKRAGDIVSGINKIAPRLLRGAYRIAFGPDIEEERAEAAIGMSRFFSGYAFDRPSGVGKPLYGMGHREITKMTKGLYSAAYKDDLGLFKKGTFGMRDVSELAMLGVKYGGGAQNTEQIVNQTKGMMSMVQTGMAIYQTMDKEGVIQSLMELTRGQIPITSTVQGESILRKVHAWAKSTNTNIKLMHRLSAETAQLFEEAGLSAPAGATFGASTVGFVKGITKGRGAIFAPREVAKLGFQSGIRQAALQTSMSLLTSGGFTNQAMRYQYAETILPEATPEKLKTFRTGIIADISRGVKPDLEQAKTVNVMLKDRLKKSLMSTGMPEPVAEAQAAKALPGYLAVQRREAATAFLASIREKRGDVAIQRMGATTAVKGALVEGFGMKEERVDTLLEQAREGDTAARTTIESFMTRHYQSTMGRKAGLTHAAIVSRISVMSPNQVEAARDKSKEAKRIAVETAALERSRVERSAFDTLKYGLATEFKEFGIGDAMMSMVPKFSWGKGSMFPSITPRALSGRGAWSRPGPLSADHLRDYQEHVKNMSVGGVISRQMNWFQDAHLTTQHAYFESMLGTNIFTREGVFGKGGFYPQAKTAFGKLGTESFTQSLKQLGKKGITTTGEEMFEALKGTKLTYFDFAGFLQAQGGEYKNMKWAEFKKDKVAIGSYLSFLDNIGKIKGSENLETGRKILSEFKGYIGMEGGQGDKYAQADIGKIYPKEELNKRIQAYQDLCTGNISMDNYQTIGASRKFIAHQAKLGNFIKKSIKGQEEKAKFKFEVQANVLEKDRSSILARAMEGYSSLDLKHAKGYTQALSKDLGFTTTDQLSDYFQKVAKEVKDKSSGKDLLSSMFLLKNSQLKEGQDPKRRLARIIRGSASLSFLQASKGEAYKDPFQAIIKEIKAEDIPATTRAGVSAKMLEDLQEKRDLFRKFAEGTTKTSEGTVKLITEMKALANTMGDLIKKLDVKPEAAVMKGRTK
jgi:hypothetical protein